jgi:hypothetical protein
MYTQNYKSFKLENLNTLTIAVAKQWIRVVLFSPSGRQIEQYKYATQFLNLKLFGQELKALTEDDAINSAIVAFTEKILKQL